MEILKIVNFLKHIKIHMVVDAWLAMLAHVATKVGGGSRGQPQLHKLVGASCSRAAPLDTRSSPAVHIYAHIYMYIYIYIYIYAWGLLVSSPMRTLICSTLKLAYAAPVPSYVCPPSHYGCQSKPQVDSTCEGGSS